MILCIYDHSYWLFRKQETGQNQVIIMLLLFIAILFDKSDLFGHDLTINTNKKNNVGSQIRHNIVFCLFKFFVLSWPIKSFFLIL